MSKKNVLLGNSELNYMHGSLKNCALFPSTKSVRPISGHKYTQRALDLVLEKHKKIKLKLSCIEFTLASELLVLYLNFKVKYFLICNSRKLT